jgi:hypothetical protein
MAIRFQFSLRAVVVAMTVAAAACAIWINLPGVAKLVVVLLVVPFWLFVEALARVVRLVVLLPSEKDKGASD